MKIKLVAFILFTAALSGCDLIFEGLLSGPSEPERRPDICTSSEIPPTPAGATPEEVEAEVAALCNP